MGPRSEKGSGSRGPGFVVGQCHYTTSHPQKARPLHCCNGLFARVRKPGPDPAQPPNAAGSHHSIIRFRYIPPTTGRRFRYGPIGYPSTLTLRPNLTPNPAEGGDDQTPTTTPGSGPESRGLGNAGAGNLTGSSTSNHGKEGRYGEGRYYDRTVLLSRSSTRGRS